MKEIRDKMGSGLNTCVISFFGKQAHAMFCYVALRPSSPFFLHAQTLPWSVGECPLFVGRSPEQQWGASTFMVLLVLWCCTVENPYRQI